MSNDFAQFQDAFFEEAGDHLAIVEEGLLALEQHPEDLDLLNKIFRSAHSIKGTSGMFGMKLPAASCGVSQKSISQTSQKQRRTP